MIDSDELEKAFNNEENTQLLDLTNKKIETVKIKMLNKLNLSKKQFKEISKKLENYRYIDELPELKYGSFIRWISLKNPEVIKLSNGGLVMEIKIDLSGIKIVCKNNMNRFFQINMNENLIFQKLNNQENVLLSALDYINQ
jgi:hypothetical protein